MSAPVQVMTLGHPASSRSMEIDYVLCDEGAIGELAHVGERLVRERVGGGARHGAGHAPTGVDDDKRRRLSQTIRRKRADILRFQRGHARIAARRLRLQADLQRSGGEGHPRQRVRRDDAL